MAIRSVFNSPDVSRLRDKGPGGLRPTRPPVAAGPGSAFSSAADRPGGPTRPPVFTPRPGPGGGTERPRPRPGIGLPGANTSPWGTMIGGQMVAGGNLNRIAAPSQGADPGQGTDPRLGGLAGGGGGVQQPGGPGGPSPAANAPPNQWGPKWGQAPNAQAPGNSSPFEPQVPPDPFASQFNTYEEFLEGWHDRRSGSDFNTAVMPPSPIQWEAQKRGIVLNGPEEYAQFERWLEQQGGGTGGGNQRPPVHTMPGQPSPGLGGVNMRPVQGQRPPMFTPRPGGFDHSSQLDRFRAQYQGANNARGNPINSRYSYGARQGRGGRPPVFSAGDAANRERLMAAMRQRQNRLGQRPPVHTNPVEPPTYI